MTDSTTRTTTVDLADLRRILVEGAGVADGTTLDEHALDVSFEDLGYDSVAMLETATRISREFGLHLDDEVVIQARTPRELLAAVNATR